MTFSRKLQILALLLVLCICFETVSGTFPTKYAIRVRNGSKITLSAREWPKLRDIGSVRVEFSLRISNYSGGIFRIQTDDDTENAKIKLAIKNGYISYEVHGHEFLSDSILTTKSWHFISISHDHTSFTVMVDDQTYIFGNIVLGTPMLPSQKFVLGDNSSFFDVGAFEMFYGGVLWSSISFDRSYISNNNEDIQDSQRKLKIGVQCISTNCSVDWDDNVVQPRRFLSSTPSTFLPPVSNHIGAFATGLTEEEAGQSCTHIKLFNPSSSTGAYWVKPRWNYAAFQVYCNMERAEGRTLILNGVRDVVPNAPQSESYDQALNGLVFSAGGDNHVTNGPMKFEMYVGLNYWRFFGLKLYVEHGSNAETITDITVLGGVDLYGNLPRFRRSTFVVEKGQEWKYYHPSPQDITGHHWATGQKSNYCYSWYYTNWFFNTCWTAAPWGSNNPSKSYSSGPYIEHYGNQQRQYVHWLLLNENALNSIVPLRDQLGYSGHFLSRADAVRPQGTSANPAKSCSHLRTNQPNFLSGWYFIQPLSTGDVFKLYCRLEGPGYSLVLLSNYGVDNSPTPTYAEATETGLHNFNPSSITSMPEDLRSFDMFLQVNVWMKLGSYMMMEYGSGPNEDSQHVSTSRFFFQKNDGWRMNWQDITKIRGETLDTMSYNNQMKFTTKDKDNDLHDAEQCSNMCGDSPYWYRRCFYGSPWGLGTGADQGPIFAGGTHNQNHVEYSGWWVYHKRHVPLAEHIASNPGSFEVLPADGSRERPAYSCSHLFKLNNDTPSGTYWMRPIRSYQTFKTYCKMDKETGRGYEMVLLSNRGVASCVKVKLDTLLYTPYSMGESRYATEVTSDLSSYDSILSPDLWPLAGDSLRVEFGASPTDISDASELSYTLEAPTGHYIRLGNLNNIKGVTPGFYSYHNNKKMQTIDYNANACTTSSYYAGVWFYEHCWSGSPWGGCLYSHTDGPYVDNSVDDFIRDFAAFWAWSDDDDIIPSGEYLYTKININDASASTLEKRAKDKVECVNVPDSVEKIMITSLSPERDMSYLIESYPRESSIYLMENDPLLSMSDDVKPSVLFRTNKLNDEEPLSVWADVNFDSTSISLTQTEASKQPMIHKNALKTYSAVNFEHEDFLNMPNVFIIQNKGAFRIVFRTYPGIIPITLLSTPQFLIEIMDSKLAVYVFNGSEFELLQGTAVIIAPLRWRILQVIVSNDCNPAILVKLENHILYVYNRAIALPYPSSLEVTDYKIGGSGEFDVIWLSFGVRDNDYLSLDSEGKLIAHLMKTFDILPFYETGLTISTPKYGFEINGLGFKSIGESSMYWINVPSNGYETSSSPNFIPGSITSVRILKEKEVVFTVSPDLTTRIPLKDGDYIGLWVRLPEMALGEDSAATIPILRLSDESKPLVLIMTMKGVLGVFVEEINRFAVISHPNDLQDIWFRLVLVIEDDNFITVLLYGSLSAKLTLDTFDNSLQVNSIGMKDVANIPNDFIEIYFKSPWEGITKIFFGVNMDDYNRIHGMRLSDYNSNYPAEDGWYVYTISAKDISSLRFKFGNFDDTESQLCSDTDCIVDVVGSYAVNDGVLSMINTNAGGDVTYFDVSSFKIWNEATIEGYNILTASMEYPNNKPQLIKQRGLHLLSGDSYEALNDEWYPLTTIAELEIATTKIAEMGDSSKNSVSMASHIQRDDALVLKHNFNCKDMNLKSISAGIVAQPVDGFCDDFTDTTLWRTTTGLANINNQHLEFAIPEGDSRTGDTIYLKAYLSSVTFSLTIHGHFEGEFGIGFGSKNLILIITTTTKLIRIEDSSEVPSVLIDSKTVSDWSGSLSGSESIQIGFGLSDVKFRFEGVDEIVTLNFDESSSSPSESLTFHFYNEATNSQINSVVIHEYDEVELALFGPENTADSLFSNWELPTLPTYIGRKDSMGDNYSSEDDHEFSEVDIRVLKAAGEGTIIAAPLNMNNEVSHIWNVKSLSDESIIQLSTFDFNFDGSLVLKSSLSDLEIGDEFVLDAIGIPYCLATHVQLSSNSEYSKALTPSCVRSNTSLRDLTSQILIEISEGANKGRRFPVGCVGTSIVKHMGAAGLTTLSSESLFSLLPGWGGTDATVLSHGHYNQIVDESSLIISVHPKKESTSPVFESEWFSMGTSEDEISFIEIAHGIKDITSCDIRVIGKRPFDDETSFEDDDIFEFGFGGSASSTQGLSWTYSSSGVQLYVPVCRQCNGILPPKKDQSDVFYTSAMVKVIITPQIKEPTFTSEWITMNSRSGPAYKEISHGDLIMKTSKVKVTGRISDSDGGHVFVDSQGIVGTSPDGENVDSHWYSGITHGFEDERTHIWIPSSTYDPLRSCYMTLQTGIVENGPQYILRSDEAEVINEYCLMDSAISGGGWDLVTSVISGPLKFGLEICGDPNRNCASNIKDDPSTHDDSITSIENNDVEVLLYSFENEDYWVIIDGLHSSDDLLDTYMSNMASLPEILADSVIDRIYVSAFGSGVSISDTVQSIGGTSLKIGDGGFSLGTLTTTEILVNGSGMQLGEKGGIVSKYGLFYRSKTFGAKPPVALNQGYPIKMASPWGNGQRNVQSESVEVRVEAWSTDNVITTKSKATYRITIVDVPSFELPLLSINTKVREFSKAGTLVTHVLSDDDSVNCTTDFAHGNTGNAFKLSENGQSIIVNDPSLLDAQTNSYFGLVMNVCCTESELEYCGESFFNVRLSSEAAPNQKPQMVTSSGTIYSIIENARAGKSIGTPLLATDPDEGQDISFAILSGVDDGAIRVGSCNGQFQVAEDGILDFSVKSRYEVEVEVTDSGIPPLTDSITVFIDILDTNDPPIFKNSSIAVEFPENSPKDFEVVDASIYAYDEEGDTLKYSFSSVAPGFKLNESTGKLTVSDPSLFNYEDVRDFFVRVRVEDDYGYADMIVQMALTDVNDAPTLLTTSLWLPEGSAKDFELSPSLSASDEDTPDAFDGTFEKISGDDGDIFTVASDIGIVTFIGEPFDLDFETKSSYTLVIRVTDKGTPPASSDMNLTINLYNVNEAPFFDQSSLAFSIAEHCASPCISHNIVANDPEGDRITYLLVDPVSNRFVIDESGVVTVASSTGIDYESLKVSDYKIKLPITITDESGVSTIGEVVITVTDVNENPSFTPAAVYASFVTFEVGVKAIVAMKSSIDELPDNCIVLDNSDGSIENANDCHQQCSDTPTCNGWMYYDSNYHDESFRTKCIQTTENIDIDSRSPELTGLETVYGGYRIVPGVEINVPENTVDDTPIGSSLVSQVSDEDAGDTTFVFTLGNPSNGAITLVSDTGAMDIATSSLFDFETTTDMVYRVNIADPQDAFTTTVVHLTVSDINEKPIIDQDLKTSMEIDVRSVASGDIILDGITVTDPENDRIIFSVPDDDEWVVIAPLTGAVSMKSPLPTIALDDSHNVVVTATDAADNTSTVTLSVSVFDSDHGPIVDPTFARTVAENSGANVPLGDPIAVTAQASASQDFVFRIEDETVDLLDGSSVQMTDFFAIDQSGQLSTRVSLNFELKSSYDVKLVITNTGGVAKSTVTVTVTNVNDLPILIVPELFIEENAIMDGDASETLNVKEISDVFTIFDEDSVTVSCQFSGSATCYNPSDEVALCPTDVLDTLEISTDKSETVDRTWDISIVSKISFDYEVTSKLEVLFSCKDEDEADISDTLTIFINNMNEAPTISSDELLSIPEDTSIGTTVKTVVGADPDIGSILSYTLISQTIDGTFLIDRSSGEIKLQNNVDFEITPSHTITIEVSDIVSNPTDMQKTTQYIDVTITDVFDVEITNVVSSNPLNTAGGNKFNIIGTNFGAATGSGWSSSDFIITYGTYIATSCSVLEGGNIEIECTSIPGVGLNHEVCIEVGRQKTCGGSLSYGAPTIIELDYDRASTTGGDDVDIVGNNFGALAGDTFIMTYANDDLDLSFDITCNVVSADATKATCPLSPGFGSGFKWKAMVGGQSTEWTDPNVVDTMFSYDTPVVTRIELADNAGGLFKTTGDEELIVEGSNFGPKCVDSDGSFCSPVPELVLTNGKFTLRLECSVTTADIEMSCITVAGTGINYTVQAIIGSQTGIVGSGLSMSFEPPILTQILGDQDMDTTGGQVISIKGNGFGPMGTVPDWVKYGPVDDETHTQPDLYEAIDCEVVVAHTMMKCVSVPGTGFGYSWQLSMDSQLSDVLHSNSTYMPPVIIYFKGDGISDPSAMQTEGSEKIIVTGRYFGNDSSKVDMVVYGTADYVASCTITDNDVELTCITSAGVGRSLGWTVKVDGLLSRHPLTHYAPPSVTGISGLGSLEASCAGDEEVKILGDNFGEGVVVDGKSVLQGRVTYTEAGSSLFYEAEDCYVSFPHKQITCNTVPGSGNMKWFVEVSGQTSEECDTCVSSFADPKIVSLSSGVGDTDGGDVITLKVTDIATDDPFSSFALFLNNVRMATEVVLTTEKITDGEHERPVKAIDLTIPEGVGKDLPLWLEVTTIGGTVKQSSIETFSYSPPEIRTIYTKVDDSVAPNIVTITVAGNNFGGDISNAIIYLNDEIMNVNQSNFTHNLFSITTTDADLKLASPTCVDLCGDVKIEVIGCSYEIPAAERSDKPECKQSSEIVSFSHVSPTVGSDSLVNVGGESYYPDKMPTDGSGWIEIVTSDVTGVFVMNFKKYGTGSDPIWADTCISIEIDAENKLVKCQVPEGTGKHIEVELVRNGVAAEPFYMDYLPPSITEEHFTDTLTSGGFITLSGSNLGKDSSVGVVGFRKGGVYLPCSSTAWTHDEITCAMPEGSGSGYALVVYVDEQECEECGSTSFAYGIPVITHVLNDSSDGFLDTAGGNTLTIVGKNFGNIDSNLSAKLGDFDLSCTITTPHTDLSCTTDAGQGKEYSIVVTVSGLSSIDSTMTESYRSPIINSFADKFGNDEPILLPSSGMYSNFTVLESIVLSDTHSLTSVYQRRVVENQEEQELESALQIALDSREPFIVVASGSDLCGDCRSNAPSHILQVDGHETALESLSSTEFEFESPKGMKSSIPIIFQSGSFNENGMTHVWETNEQILSYAPPRIMKMAPRRAPTSGCLEWSMNGSECITSATAVVYGTNFATKGVMEDCLKSSLSSDDCTLEVHLCDNDGVSNCVECDVDFTSGDWTNEKIKFSLPSGSGYDLQIRVTVGSTYSNTVNFSYDKPTVTSVNPFGYDSRSDTVKLLGDNFGESVSDVAIEVEEMTCRNANWLKGSGRPYITCDTPVDVTVGYKSASVSVAGQTVDIVGDSYSPFFSRCPEGWYGQLGEVCNPCCPDETSNDFIDHYEKSCSSNDDCFDHGMRCQEGKCTCLRGTECSGEFIIENLDRQCETCDWEFEEPKAQKGWWLQSAKKDSEDVDLCEVNRQTTRDECHYTSPCEPAEACLEANTCAEGYQYLQLKCKNRRESMSNSCNVDSDCHSTGNNECSTSFPENCSKCVMHTRLDTDLQTLITEGQCECQPSTRCALCTSEEYFREAGECVECPQNILLVILMLIAAGMLVSVSGYVLNKKAVNLAFVSIAVDYFQVLAIFRRSNVDWPSELRTFFRIFSVFNFNLDLAAPECAMPNLDYDAKWFFIQALPLMAAVLFLMIHIFKWTHKRLILKNKKKATSHVAMLISVFLVTFYYLYLYLLRMQLEIFNCTETEPYDGYYYTEFSSSSCNGMCRCWESGGIHLKLLPFAIITFILFSIGFPVFVARIIWKNKRWIQLDQLLRAYGFNDGQKGKRITRVEVGSECYDLRKRYSRIYYHFKPTHYYWILMIIARKFLIAGTSLLFRQNASFQMAMCLLVMFAAYALHVRHSPYMSPSEYQSIVEKYERGITFELPMVQRSRLSQSLETNNAQRRIRKAAGLGAKNNTPIVKRTLNFFWNYNTVEMVLLGCSVFINLAGIMFESGRFDSGTSYYDAQRSLLTWITIFVIVFSLIYLALVLGSEIMETMSAGKQKKPNKRKSVKMDPDNNDSPAINIAQTEAMLAPTNMCYNPMMARVDNDVPESPSSAGLRKRASFRQSQMDNAETVKLQEELVMLRQKVRLLEETKSSSPRQFLAKRTSVRVKKKQQGYVRPANLGKLGTSISTRRSGNIVKKK
eukprot:TRINITY_DN323_c0_g3_i1.p1 TRINITY_DN323_c0_g3~~TRINITY_DN323_c0_g3_i1.p1  ORF type:complete len:6065 (+),score=1822.54 TRINITY_DN323_c0_g3_i1:50-18244(+)